MRKEQVSIGKVYAVKVSGKVQPVKLTRDAGVLGGWYGINLTTNREIRVYTAGKLRRELPVKEATPPSLADVIS